MARCVWKRGSAGCEMSVTLKRVCQLEARPSLSAHQFIPGLFSIWAGMSGWYGEWPPLASLCAGAMEDMWGGVRTDCWREERTEIESRVGGDTQRSYWKSSQGDMSDPPGPGFVFFKRFTESFYIWLLEWVQKHSRRERGEREKERGKWTDGVGWGLSLCTVWLSACGYSMVQLKLSQQHLTCTGHTSIHTDLYWKQTCNTDNQVAKWHFYLLLQ